MVGKKELEVERGVLIKKVPVWVKVVRGSLKKYYLTCGNKGCRCHRGKGNRHGPYWYLNVGWAGGRQKMYLMPEEKVREIKAGIKAYREMWNKLCEISEINIKIIRGK